MFKSILGGAIGLGVADMLANLRMMPEITGPSRYFGTNKYLNSRFDPRINRHTGKPHEHAREIARNQRRAAA